MRTARLVRMETGTKPLRLFFTYFGGKHRAAKLYPPPVHDSIVEPFAGSAGYALNYPDANVLLVERDPAVAAVWRYLLTATPDDIAALPLVGEGWTTTDDLTDLPTGARNLIGFWLNKATVRPEKRPSSSMQKWPQASWWGPRVRDRIATQLPAIRHWQLVEGDYTQAPHLRATWFVDPPYIGAGHRYAHGSAGIDYPALSRWCRTRVGQVIVCEGPGADWLPFAPLANVKGQRTQVCEYVWQQGAAARPVAM